MVDSQQVLLGSGGFIVYDDTSCIVNTGILLCFYHHESCGQCSPCREGTGWLEKSIVWRIENGQGREEDIDLLWSIQVKLKETRFVH
jgi:NADH-quinone oxidoreductase subunit F